MSSSEEEEEDNGLDEHYLDPQKERFLDDLRRVRENNPSLTFLHVDGDNFEVPSFTEEEWEQLGRDISNNTHLEQLYLHCNPFGNKQCMASFFRGLTKSSTINTLHHSLCRNQQLGFVIQDIQGMVPFFRNATNLLSLDVRGISLTSEGFSLMFRALRDSPIEYLNCNQCGIESIEIENDRFPKKLETLYLAENNINTDGCREVAKLLQGRNSTLQKLDLQKNKIDGEGVEILADALENNATLKHIDLDENKGTSTKGDSMFLKLLIDISSIHATLQSNHTLEYVILPPTQQGNSDEIWEKVIAASHINKKFNSAEAGKQKVICTQLKSTERAALCRFQGVEQCNAALFSQIDPLHLPEVLAIIGQKHGQEELYVALKSSVAALFSTVNEKQYLTQQIEYTAAMMKEYESKLKALQTRLATVEEAEEMENRSTKRPRT